MKIQDVICWAAVAACFIVAAALYSRMPERMAIHWNAQSVADGYAGKLAGLFLLPAIILIMQILLIIIPKIEVYKKNMEDFSPHYTNFRLIFILFMSGLYATTLLWNIGKQFNISYYVIPALSILFYYIGHMMKYVKRNFFVGIRTPWTLASEEVWNKTHILGSKVFKVMAGVILIGLIAPAYTIWITLVAVLVGALYLILYSYKIGRGIQL